MADELPPLDDMDDAFSLADNIVDEKWRRLYEVLIARMRREASHLTMSTVQLLLIERIAYNYIILRVKESLNANEGGFAHATAQKEFNTFWLSMTQEFNRQLKGTDSEFRNALMKQLAGVVSSVIDEIDDPETKRRMRDKLAHQLEEAGL